MNLIFLPFFWEKAETFCQLQQLCKCIADKLCQGTIQLEFQADAVGGLLVHARTTENSLKMQNWGFSRWLSGRESAYNAGDAGSTPGSGRSPGEGHGYPLQ